MVWLWSMDIQTVWTGSAEVTGKNPSLSLPLLPLFLAAVRMYWQVPEPSCTSGSLQQLFWTGELLLIHSCRVKSTNQPTETSSPKVRAFELTPQEGHWRRVVLLQILPLWIHHIDPTQFLARVEIFAPALHRAHIRPCIFAVCTSVVCRRCWLTLIRSGRCESVKIKFLSVRFTIRSEVCGVTPSACECARVSACECVWSGGCVLSI